MTMITGAGPAQTQAKLLRLQKKLDKIEDKLEVLIAQYQPPPPPPMNPLQQWIASVNAWLNQFYPVTPVAPVAPTPAPARRSTDFVISTFNVLGSSHTRADGNKPGMRSGPERMKDAVRLLKEQKVEVVGFQEFERDQMGAFKKLTNGSWGTFPGEKNSANAIAWDKAKWSLVKGDTFKVPYFNGQLKDMPVVRLQNKATGQEIYVINVHNPADTYRFHHQEGHRDQATANEIALINRLKAQGLPVFFTGDMNERQETRDKVVAGTDLAPAEKSKKAQGIDWIFGSEDTVSFSGYTRRRDALVKRATDHPMVVAKAHIRA